MLPLYLLGWTIIFITKCAQAKLSYFDHNYISTINESLQNKDISRDCLDQLESYYNGIMAMEQWAWRMLDAHGTVPSGVLYGNLFDLGNYDECLDIRTGNLTGKYCLGTVPKELITAVIPKKLRKGTPFENPEESDRSFLGVHSGICIPNKCTAKDAHQVYPLQIFLEQFCYTKDSLAGLDKESFTTIIILSFFLFLALISTAYDVYLHYKGKKPNNEISIAFSYFTNGRKLFTFASDKNSDQLLCLHGLKAISMMWIVVSHEYLRLTYGPIINFTEVIEFPKRLGNMFILGASVAVDTFFLIGGLITVYTFLKATDKGVKFNVFFYYIHRYVRLTPAFAIVILIHATLLNPLADGPLWNGFNNYLVEPCRKYYWAALLYIQNFTHDDEAICVPQSWYLSIDMQLFILSPLVLIPLIRKPKWTLAILTLLGVVGIIVPFLVVYYHELRASLYTDKGRENYLFYYYEQTHCRFAPYVIGMISGYFMYKVKQGRIQIRLKPLTALFLWALCLGGGLACVYAGHDVVAFKYDKWASSFYLSLNSSAWSIAISGLIFLCVSGYGGPIDVFLSAPLFQFLSKISYAIYLVHYELILLRLLSLRTQYMMGHFTALFYFWGDFMFSALLALLLCLTFESPMITIEKLLFNTTDSSKRKKKSTLNV